MNDLNPTHTGDSITTDCNNNKPLLVHGVLIGNLRFVVKEDAGGFPYIPVIELFDYNNGQFLAKKGEIVRVIIIKEE